MLTVWWWFGRDRISLYDLEYLVAAPSRHEWRQVVLRLSLPDWKSASPIKERDERHAIGAAAPGRVVWRELGTVPWHDEAALVELRRTSTLRGLGAGHGGEP